MAGAAELAVSQATAKSWPLVPVVEQCLAPGSGAIVLFAATVNPPAHARASLELPTAARILCRRLDSAIACRVFKNKQRCSTLFVFDRPRMPGLEKTMNASCYALAINACRVAVSLEKAVNASCYALSTIVLPVNIQLENAMNADCYAPDGANWFNSILLGKAMNASCCTPSIGELFETYRWKRA